MFRSRSLLLGSTVLALLALSSGASAQEIILRATPHFPSEATPTTPVDQPEQPDALTVTSRSFSLRSGQTLSFSPMVTGATGSTRFSLAGIDVPSWLSIDGRSGALLGVAQAGRWSDLAIAAAGGGSSASSPTFSVSVSEPLVASAGIPALVRSGRPVSGAVTAAGGVPPYSFSLSGAPAWLQADATTGVVSGTAVAGAYEFQVRAGDGVESDARDVTLEVTAPLTVSTDLPATLVADATISSSVVATGGVAPYTYSLVDAPSWLEVDPVTGALSGTAAVGVHAFKVRAVDAEENDETEVSLTVDVRRDFVASLLAMPQYFGSEGMAVAPDGSTYVVGSMQANAIDAAIVKRRPDGTVEWTRRLDGAATRESFAAVAVDASGNAYAAGRTHRYGSTAEALLVKFSPSGQILWQKVLGGSGTDEFLGVAVSGTRVYAVGTTSSKGAAQIDGLVSSWNLSGEFVRHAAIGGSSHDYFRSVAVAPDGFVYVVGNSPITGSDDVFVARYDASLNLSWAKVVGGTGSDSGYAIVADEWSHAHLVGYVDNVDMLVTRVLSNGSVNWQRRIGGAGQEWGKAIAVSGRKLFVGGFSNSASPELRGRRMGVIATLDVVLGELGSVVAVDVGTTSVVGALAVSGADLVVGLESDQKDGRPTTGLLRLASDLQAGGRSGSTRILPSSFSSSVPTTTTTSVSTVRAMTLNPYDADYIASAFAVEELN